jgi:3-oxoacyl-[acyl-carrier-protein] synthase II
MNRVVVTGIGMATPLGTGRERNWANLLNGISAVSRDDRFGGVLTARVNGLDVPDQTRLLSLGFLAAAEALHDSGVMHSNYEPEEVGCTVSVSKPTLPGLFSDTSLLGTQLRKVFMFKGPQQNIAAACATGADSIILGAEWIRNGVCDAVICGAAEASLQPLYVGAFDNMGVLARKTVTPFGVSREGFAMGEGAAVIVLESKKTAMLRGAEPYGELSGWAMANDASSELVFDSDGATIAQAVKKALGTAWINEMEYINAHGTATKSNDLAESRAIKKAFGAAASNISISSTKAATGHLLGAAGAVEAGFCLLAMRDKVAPATLNLFDPDPECGLDFTPLVPRRRVIKNSMSLSFGFGGQIGVLVFSAL